MNQNRKAKATKTIRIVVFVSMMLVGGWTAYQLYQWEHRQKVPQDPDQEPTAGLTPQEVVAAIQRKDAAIGHLENGAVPVEVEGEMIPSIDAAARGFDQLAQLVPTEILPLQDLVIARLLQLRGAEREVAQVRDQARGRPAHAGGGAAVGRGALAGRSDRAASGPHGSHGRHG